MKIITETNLQDFKFWSGAKDTYKMFEELYTAGYDGIFDMLEDCIESMYAEDGGITETELNDLFWFEPETLLEWIGFEQTEDGWVDDSGELALDEDLNVIV